MDETLKKILELLQPTRSEIDELLADGDAFICDARAELEKMKLYPKYGDIWQEHLREYALALKMASLTFDQAADKVMKNAGS